MLKVFDGYLFDLIQHFVENVKGCVFDGFSVKFVMFSFYLSAKLFENKKQKQPNENLNQRYPFTNFPTIFPTISRQFPDNFSDNFSDNFPIISRNEKGCVICRFLYVILYVLILFICKII
jgi:hypothetical protein